MKWSRVCELIHHCAHLCVKTPNQMPSCGIIMTHGSFQSVKVVVHSKGDDGKSPLISQSGFVPYYQCHQSSSRSTPKLVLSSSENIRLQHFFLSFQSLWKTAFTINNPLAKLADSYLHSLSTNNVLCQQNHTHNHTSHATSKASQSSFSHEIFSSLPMHHSLLRKTL